MMRSSIVPPIPFYFIRHGETEANVRGLCQGQIDFPLTAQGREQAHRAGTLLIDKGIQRVVSSSLGRATTTASIIVQVLALPTFSEHPGLSERGWGEIEGKPNEAMFAQEELERTTAWDGRSSIQGIETRAAFLARIETTLVEVLPGPAPLAIVGHGRFFNALCELLGAPPVTQIPNGVPVLCTPDYPAWRITVL